MGEAAQAQRVPDAAGGCAFGRVVARPALRRLLADEGGATAVEYGLIIACIFIAVLGAFSLFAGNTTNMYNTVSNTLGGAIR